MYIKTLFIKVVAIFFIMVTPAWADLDLEITGGMNAGRKIAIIPFLGQSSLSTNTNIADVIKADLANSGKFSPTILTNVKLDPNKIENIDSSMIPSGFEAVVVGKIIPGVKPTDPFGVRYILLENEGGRFKAITGLNSTVPLKLTRRYAHTVSDSVFSKLTGIKGAFNTRIAYVKTKFGTKHPYELVVADYDGNNEVRLIISSQPLMSPAWSPDGKKIAYVSFENRRAEIFIIDINTKQRTKLTSFKGLNSNPKWSPNGQKLAFVLSKDGNPEIYVLNIATKSLQRVTNNRAIDTEPTWSPDGNKLYFVSERTGKAQVFSINFANRGVTKETHQAVKNLSPVAMPDGSGLILINQNQGFKVSKLDRFGNLTNLTNTTLDESPSIAPNGTMVVYSTVYGGRKVLALVSTDGRFKAYLPNRGGEINAPAWSPYVK